MREMAFNLIKPPCKRNCPDRRWDCHTFCEKYIAYRAQCDQAIKERKLEREVKEAIGAAMKRIPGKREI